MQAEIIREWVTYREAEQLVGLSRSTLWKLSAPGRSSTVG
jgi:predicted DNA-binding transcriptional regulator AlpA